MLQVWGGISYSGWKCEGLELVQWPREVKTDLVLISEKYCNKDPISWHLDISATVAICVRDGVRAKDRWDGFLCIRGIGITFFSVPE